MSSSTNKMISNHPCRQDRYIHLKVSEKYHNIGSTLSYVTKKFVYDASLFSSSLNSYCKTFMYRLHICAQLVYWYPYVIPQPKLHLWIGQVSDGIEIAWSGPLPPCIHFWTPLLHRRLHWKGNLSSGRPEYHCKCRV